MVEPWSNYGRTMVEPRTDFGLTIVRPQLSPLTVGLSFPSFKKRVTFIRANKMRKKTNHQSDCFGGLYIIYSRFLMIFQICLAQL